MNIAQKTIQNLRNTWQNKCTAYDNKTKEVLKLGEQKNGVWDNDITEIVKEQHSYAMDALKARNDYHSACAQYIDTLLSYYNDGHLVEMTTQFWKDTKTTEDWYPLMEKAGFFDFDVD